MDERAALMQLAERLQRRNWWDDYGTVLAGWFCSYLVLESIAQVIRTYEVRFVPGLLQTPAYAEAVIRLGPARQPDVRRLVDVRMRRQAMLLDRKGPLLWAVIDESTLHTAIGGAAVMRQQIDFLREAQRRPNVRIQILGSGDGNHAHRGNSFSILRLGGAKLSDVVYLEQIESALFLDGPPESEPYRLAMTGISYAAGEPIDTDEILDRLCRRMAQ